MKLCAAVQEGCGYKDTLRAHRYFAPLAKYLTVCITYQSPLVYLRREDGLFCNNFIDHRGNDEEARQKCRHCKTLNDITAEASVANWPSYIGEIKESALIKILLN